MFLDVPSSIDYHFIICEEGGVVTLLFSLQRKVAMMTCNMIWSPSPQCRQVFVDFPHHNRSLDDLTLCHKVTSYDIFDIG